MALIQCPECTKEVSDKAPACIGCGYPLKAEKCYECGNDISNGDIICPKCGAPLDGSTEESTVEIINGVPVDLKEFVETKTGKIDFCKSLRETTGLDLRGCKDIADRAYEKYASPEVAPVAPQANEPSPKGAWFFLGFLIGLIVAVIAFVILVESGW
ncbi:MAG: zinc ribbon domain-containing protein [Oscillospiraceae bacterium]|nr:zinc ribbon domain-containing protein [Oscillospiraceae bacterium]